MPRIIVWDPAGELAEGTVVDGAKVAGLLHARGVVSLPFDPELATAHAIGGYFRRGWGEGWPFDTMAATRGCPLMLFVVQDRQYVHWTARLAPMREGAELQGTLRLVATPGQVGAMGGGLAAEVQPVALSQLGEPDKHGGWILRGRNRLNVTTEGYIGLNLYGAVKGVRVLWAAVTQSKQAE